MRVNDKRTRNWTFVIYPGDSAPEDWEQIIRSWNVPAFVSPLHCLDLNGDATEKKDHRHVVLMYDGPKSYDLVCQDIEPLCGTIPQPVRSLVGAVRYLTHLDNPEKAQYAREDVLEFGGAAYDEVIKLSTSDKLAQLDEIIDFIDERGIRHYRPLLNELRVTNREWYRAVVFGGLGLPVSLYLKSIYLEERDEMERYALEEARGYRELTREKMDALRAEVERLKSDAN